MSDLRLAVVIPVGPGRMTNLRSVLAHLYEQYRLPDVVVVVFDGDEAWRDWVSLPVAEAPTFLLSAPKHEPGREQPRNMGVREAVAAEPDLTHVAFLDSDVIVAPDWVEQIELAYEAGSQNRIVVGPYDWLPPELFQPAPALRNDPRWVMFRQHGPEHEYVGDVSAGLACFSGNLVWPVEDFMRVGGFWAEIHHGRCEDGELGLRAVAMGVPISLCAAARGWHLWHPRDTEAVEERNRRDVPMLNARHPWMQGAGVLMVDRDGKAFDVLCPKCQRMVPTIEWWAHAESCGLTTALPVA